MGIMRLGVAALAAAVTALAPSAAGAHRIHGLKHRFGTSTSTNWSGYTVDGSGASDVKATWTVTASTCAAKETSWSSPWVGIDGDASSTVEQTGTDSDCSNGSPSYYAWYEMYPKGTVVIGHPISPGDVMTGEVTYGPAGFTLSLSDSGPKPWSFSTVQSSAKAKRSSVEWIDEGPSTGTLTDFGMTTFTGTSATISGKTGSLAFFGASANKIAMVNKSGTVRAQPGPVQTDGSFTDAWQHA